MMTRPLLHEEGLDKVCANAINLWGVGRGFRALRPAEQRWLERQAAMTKERWRRAVESTLAQAKAEMRNLKGQGK